MSVRKKWATVHASNWQRQGVWTRHQSQAAAYRWVGQRREDHKVGMWTSPCIRIQVDEGNGWQLYERFDLAKEVRS